MKISQTLAGNLMQTMMRISLTIFLFLILTFPAEAQGTATDFMRSIGKMYVVVAVIIAVFVGLVVFMVYLDRRLTKLENQINDHHA